MSHLPLRRMFPRDPGEAHRAATSLELFFDLVFVVAVSQAAGSLHHAISTGHPGEGMMASPMGLLAYAMVFFAIWWSWVNYTWFASAYGTDDALYRVMTFAQMFGVLLLAAGVSAVFEHGDLRLAVAGFVIMRLAMVGQWLRAALSDPEGRRTALRYALGVTLVQIGWVALLAQSWGLAVYLALGAVELAVPLWAERALPTKRHPHLLAERYLLLTLIVLGESVLSTMVAIKLGMDSDVATGSLLSVAVSGFVIVCAMWWLYNERPAHSFLTESTYALPWGYGHYLVFSSAAAVGAGLSVVVDYDTGTAHLTRMVASGTVAIPVAVFLLSVWFVHIRPHHLGPIYNATYQVTALLVLATPLVPAALPLTAALMVTCVITCELTDRTRERK